MADDPTFTVTWLAHVAMEHLPLPLSGEPWAVTFSRYQELAQEFAAAHPGPLRRPGDDFPTDEAEQAFLAWLRARGHRLLEKPPGMWARYPAQDS